MKIEYNKYFPYEQYRNGQLNLMIKISNTILNKRNMILRAPSGFGKTITVLTAITPILESKEELKLIWICRTHRENNRVIEELKKIKNLPRNVDALVIEARARLCIKDLDQNLRKDHEAFSILCSELKKQGKCEYYNKALSRNLKIPQICGVKDVIKVCKDNGVCPYEVIKENICKSRIVIANYNYVLMPYLIRNLNVDFKNSILVVDEAHNLPELAVNTEGEKVTIRGLEETILEMKREGETENIGIVEKLLTLIDRGGEEKLVDKVLLVKNLERSFGSINHLAQTLIIKGNKIRRKLASRGENPISHIHHLGKFLRKLIEVISREEYEVFTGKNELWIECFDPSNILKKAYKLFESTISMSGTIDEKYGELIGLENYVYEEVSYSNKGKLLKILVENVSTDYEERSISMYKKINDYIFIVTENIKTGIGIFTASYDVLNGLIRAGIENIKTPIFIEKQYENSTTIEWKIESYKEKAKSGGAVYVGVCGGRASEGEDFPGREMDIVMLVGIPFQEPSIITEKKMEYYEKKFGEKGRLYGYILPAIWKSIQAAGRIIRGPDDKGVIVYLDRRYKRYVDLLPHWLKPEKFIKEPEQLKEEIIYFLTP